VIVRTRTHAHTHTHTQTTFSCFHNGCENWAHASQENRDVSRASRCTQSALKRQELTEGARPTGYMWKALHVARQPQHPSRGNITSASLAPRHASPLHHSRQPLTCAKTSPPHHSRAATSPCTASSPRRIDRDVTSPPHHSGRNLPQLTRGGRSVLSHRLPEEASAADNLRRAHTRLLTTKHRHTQQRSRLPRASQACIEQHENDK